MSIAHSVKFESLTSLWLPEMSVARTANGKKIIANVARGGVRTSTSLSGQLYDRDQSS